MLEGEGLVGDKFDCEVVLVFRRLFNPISLRPACVLSGNRPRLPMPRFVSGNVSVRQVGIRAGMRRMCNRRQVLYWMCLGMYVKLVSSLQWHSSASIEQARKETTLRFEEKDNKRLEKCPREAPGGRRIICILYLKKQGWLAGWLGLPARFRHHQ